MRDADERTVHCLEAIIQELHEMNRQLKIANQLTVLAHTPIHDTTDTVKQRIEELAKKLDFA